MVGNDKIPIETYLANSVDLVDLEQRQKALVYGNVNPKLERMDIMAKCIMTWFEAVGRARAASVPIKWVCIKKLRS